MARLIELRFPARCADCGAELEVGSRARYYGRGRVYGIACHPQRRGSRRLSTRVGAREGEPLGLTLSRLDPQGVFLADGTRVGSTCGCEDSPCCGH